MDPRRRSRTHRETKHEESDKDTEQRDQHKIGMRREAEAEKK